LIGRTVHELIDADPLNGIEVCFIHDAIPAALKDVDPALALEDLSKFDEYGADLVVEMAHPDVTRAWALKILEKTNYLFISVTAIADAELEAAIKECAMKNNTRAYVPHGGVVGTTKVVALGFAHIALSAICGGDCRNGRFARKPRRVGICRGCDEEATCERGLCQCWHRP
jgi:predicted dinucleotide-utilizing enzyme